MSKLILRIFALVLFAVPAVADTAAGHFYQVHVEDAGKSSRTFVVEAGRPFSLEETTTQDYVSGYSLPSGAKEAVLKFAQAWSGLKLQVAVNPLENGLVNVTYNVTSHGKVTMEPVPDTDNVGFVEKPSYTERHVGGMVTVKVGGDTTVGEGVTIAVSGI